jgi:rod shape-determining protein MreC
VGRRRSRVRLVTDSSCHPAVRAVRGGLQDRELLEHISAVQEVLASRGDLFTTDEAAAILQNNLNILRERLDPTGESCYLVKGNLCGAAEQSWRGGGTLLRGEGFNYDYADAHGPARDLRTGCTADAPDSPGIPLIQQGDLLVTSGLDGLFPEGLAVGRVVKVMPLVEGAYCYELLATAVAGNLSELRYVFVLPPQK